MGTGNHHQGMDGKRTVIGSGIYILDTIVVREYPAWPAMRPFEDRVAVEEAGGTCGNVMAMLAWLGWNARPQACLDDSPEGLRLADDLRRYGCDCRYVTNTPGGGTTLLRCTHKRAADGTHTMSVRAGSPGGSRFPKHHFLRARDEAPAFLDGLDGVPDVYFFDDPAAGHRLIARELKARGALVYFEPSRLSDPADLQAMALADIVKFSGELIREAPLSGPGQLFIQTLGSSGLRFSLRGASWETVPPAPCGEVVDWEGAGDWTSAVFIHSLFRNGFHGMDGLTEEAVRRALVTAQGVAARSVGHLSSKGLIHSRDGAGILVQLTED